MMATLLTELFPIWVGDQVLNAIELALQRDGLDVETTDLLLRAKETEVNELETAARRLHGEGLGNPVDLAHRVQNKQIEKHHAYLREELLALDYASQYLDCGSESALGGN